MKPPKKSGRCALITGASSGIGRATAIRFAREGFDTAIAARDIKALEETAKLVESQGVGTLSIQADLTDRETIPSVVDQAVSTFGRLDALVCAAGIIASGTVEDTTSDAWDTMMEINLTSVFLLMKHAVPHLEKTCGAIVNVSSVTGCRAFPGVLAYCVSKAAVDQLTRCAALELAQRSIRVNNVNPGVVRTQLHRRAGMDEKAYADFVEHSRTTHPLGRIGEPEEVAELIVFLATDRAAWMTGETIAIDGGRAQTCAR